MKAVLVIDMPDDMEISETYIVGVTLYNGIFTKDISMKCSLRPLPKKNLEEPFVGGEPFNTYICGWNDCLLEIMGETE